MERDLLNFRREAARPLSRDLTRTLPGGEPVALTGRLGGTDEFLGRGGTTPPQCLLLAKERAPDPDNVFGAASCGHPEWKFAGAADAKESTANRETREPKQEFFGIPECAY